MWLGGVHDGGHVCQGMYVAGCVCVAGGCAWPGGLCGEGGHAW